MFKGLVHVGGIKPTARGNSITVDMTERTRRFMRAEARARVAAAKAATDASQAKFVYLRQIHAPREGRETTGGRLRGMLQWEAARDATQVRFDHKELDRKARHWIIMEIGTGKRAVMRHGQSSQPGNRTGRARGRTRNDNPDLRIVSSQVGRPIAYIPFTDTGIRTRISPTGPAPIVIRREIQGKHFVREGAKAGHRTYRRQLIAAARSSFGTKGGGKSGKRGGRSARRTP